MLCVKTTVKESPIHGLGLFADQQIEKGTVIWKFVEGFDQTYLPDNLENLPLEAKVFLARHAYMSKRTGRYILDTDDGRYFNHSEKPNTATSSMTNDSEDTIVAIININKGEEITINYSDQENEAAANNKLWHLYSKLNLKDEIDPRIKN